MSEQIVVKSMKDKARDLINIYHDSPENFSNMLKENIANSLDIFKKNFSHRPNNEIKIILHNPNKIEFIDNASGIPVEGFASDGRPNYEAIFEIDGAGSNYSKDIDSAGQHGVFLYTLSMSSKDIEYFVARPNGNVYNIAYHKGDRIHDLKVIETNHDKDDTYTKIIFSLDNEVWVNPSFTFEEICKIAQPQSSLYNNLTITVEDKQNNNIKIFHYDNPLIDYFNEQTQNINIITDTVHIKTIEPYDFKKMGTNIDLHDDIKINLYFNYGNDNDMDFKKEFINTADLIQYGKVQDGIIDGLKYSINKWLETNNKYNKNEKHITNDDVMSCLNYICDVRCKYVKFAGQIKQSTKENKFKIILSKVVKEQLEIYFIENPIQTEKICTQVLINSRARENANKTRKNILKKLSDKNNGFNRVEGLVDCKYHDKRSELHITEGRSALGSVLLSRDPNFQGCYPIRGKILNCLKASEKSIFDNEIVVSLCKILNCGIQLKSKHNKELNTFDISKLRFNSIFIDTDADKDGESIQVLLLTMIYKLMPQLLIQGRVYISQPPLYVIRSKKENYYAFNDEEKDEITKQLKSQYKVNYIKGLGEMNKKDMYNTVLNPTTRRPIKVTIESFDEMVKQFDIWMDTDVTKRKEFIIENLPKYMNDCDND